MSKTTIARNTPIYYTQSMFTKSVSSLPSSQNVRWVGAAIGGFFVLVLILLIPYFSKVFSGEWLLNQTLVRIRLDYISLFGFEVPVGDIAIRYYSLLFFAGIVAGFSLAVYLFRISYLPSTLVDRLFIGIILFGLIGARTLFVLSNLTYYSASPEKILLIYEGGLSIFGGLMGGFLYVWYYAKRYRFNIFEILDILAPSILLGQIIGRFGNFFNYEAYGGPTAVAWKMFVPDQAVNANKYEYVNQLSQYFHPTFLYEIIPNILLLTFLLWTYGARTRRHAGLVAALYLIGYGSIRFFTEFFRLDALRIPLGWSLQAPQWLVDVIHTLLGKDGLGAITVAFLSPLRIENLLISQIIALLVIILGIWLYRRRIATIYSREKLSDLN